MREDRNHSAAAGFLQGFRNQNALLVTSDYVLDEFLTFLRIHSTHKNAVKIGREILRSPSVRLESVDRATWKQAWKIFQRYEDKLWSFTDCTSFAVMDRLRISHAFAFDQDFEEYGKQIIPERKAR